MFGKRRAPQLGEIRVDTLIGEQTQIHGTIQSKGTIRVDGAIEGSVEHAEHLVVGPNGHVTADVKVKAMTVAGEVKGEVRVEGKLELLSGSRLIGDVHTAHFVIHEGALFQGRSFMGDPVPAKEQEAQAEPQGAGEQLKVADQSKRNR